MPYFADLTPYVYGHVEADVLTVGWLTREHPFPTAPPPAALVAALLRCCRYPENLYRGYHLCGFCPCAGFEIPTLRFQGRRARYLGNGEIRAQGSDGRWYAAPTLVAHYVAVHHYAPPTAFCEAVLNTAGRLPTIDGRAFSALAEMSPAERFHLCLDLLRTAAATAAHPWGERTLASIVAAAPAIDPQRWEEMRVQVDAMQRARVLPEDLRAYPPTWLSSAVRFIMVMLGCGRVPESFDEETLDLAATVIEELLGSPCDFSEPLSRLTRSVPGVDLTRED